MKTLTNNTQVWFNLPRITRQYLLLLKETQAYLTIEPTILKPLITILNTYLPKRNFDLNDLIHALNTAKLCGWIVEEPLTATIKIHPFFASFLNAQEADPEQSTISKSFTEFYSSYANYLLEQYLQSGNDELRLEGLKIVFFEFFNLEKALFQSISQQMDFLHLYHLLDRTLDANEDHQRRLHFTKKIIQFAEGITFSDELLYLQFVELQSFSADVYYRLGDYNSAENLYRMVLEIFRSKSAYQESAMVLVNLANILSDQARYEPAVAYYKEAIDLVQGHPEMDEKMESTDSTLQKTWQNLGMCYYQNRQLDLARAALEQSRQYARSDSDEFAEAMVSFHIGQIEQLQGNRRQAADLYTHVAEVYHRHAFDFGIAEINQQMGMLLMDSGKPERALEAYYMALELFLSLNLPRSVAQIYNNLAHVSFETGLFLEARDYYMRGLELAYKHNIPQVEGWCLIGLGAVALEFDQLDLSEKYQQQAHTIFVALNEAEALDIIAFNFAKIEQERSESPIR